MVKGITKQVIVVHSPEPKLFEQAIFILREDAMGEGITDEMLLKEAKMATRQERKGRTILLAPLWSCAGAGMMGLIWLLCSIL